MHFSHRRNFAERFALACGAKILWDRYYKSWGINGTKLDAIALQLCWKSSGLTIREKNQTWFNYVKHAFKMIHTIVDVNCNVNSREKVNRKWDVNGWEIPWGHSFRVFWSGKFGKFSYVLELLDIYVLYIFMPRGLILRRMVMIPFLLAHHRLNMNSNNF